MKFSGSELKPSGASLHTAPVKLESTTLPRPAMLHRPAAVGCLRQNAVISSLWEDHVQGEWIQQLRARRFERFRHTLILTLKQ